MAFILLVRDGSAVRLLSMTVFETRQDALAAIPLAQAPTGAEELFLVDLEMASPIIVVPQQATPAAEAEPHNLPEDEPAPEHSAEESAGVWEAPVAEEVEAVEPDEPPAPLESEAPAEEPAVEDLTVEEFVLVEIGLDLAEPAAEAVVAPSAEFDEDGPALTEALRRATGALESAGIVAPESIAAIQVEPDSSESAPASWPWDVSAEPEPEPEAAPAYVPDPLEEPAADVEDLVYAEGADEALSLSRPVIMGAYAEQDAEAVEASTEMPDAEEERDALALEDEPIIPVYEAGGSDIAELTCDECVYINTCPKKGESDPSSCGSFQWRAV